MDRQSLRILHAESSLGWGGQEHRTFKEMVALRERGHTLELVCQPGAKLGERLAAEGYAVHHVRMRNGADLAAVWRMRRLLRHGRFDVLNTHSGRDSLLAGMAGRLAGTPLIVRTRHLALPLTSLATYTWLPHRVVSVSEHVRQYLIGEGVPAAHAATIYTGIQAPEPVASTLRAELKLPADAIVVGTVAILRAKKGHRELLEAAKPLLAQNPALHLVWAGNGPQYDNLSALLASEGLTDRVHLLGLRRDVANVLGGCDVFALATHQEALGTSYIEAMAMGLPVIGTRVDGVPEVIEDGVNGLLVPAQDVPALRGALETLIADPALRQRMGEAGRAITRTRFAVATMAGEMEAFYLKSLAERRHA
ncbi:glycosyltransferase [Chitiniphilus shinanonensis]|uniref:glycosyltransferase n=1 Tax=Chitiniphilus shinanonensis TaxID=553088 RepID=UPI003047E8FF